MGNFKNNGVSWQKRAYEVNDHDFARDAVGKAVPYSIYDTLANFGFVVVGISHETPAFVVAANQGASLAAYPPFSWPGGSMVVDYDGRVLAQADPGPGEKVVVAPIDLRALREERERRVGHDMRSHLRSEVHTYLDRSRMAPAGDHPITAEGLRLRIDEARGKVQ